MVCGVLYVSPPPGMVVSSAGCHGLGHYCSSRAADHGGDTDYHEQSIAQLHILIVAETAW